MAVPAGAVIFAMATTVGSKKTHRMARCGPTSGAQTANATTSAAASVYDAIPVASAYPERAAAFFKRIN